jgi:hypothetical protein
MFCAFGVLFHSLCLFAFPSCPACLPACLPYLQLSHRVTLLQRNGALPARETCEVLVLDRSVDPVAPVIHEWTYEALVYDLLSLDDNIIRWASTVSDRALLPQD